MTDSQPNLITPANEKTSVLLKRVLDELTEESIRVGSLLYKLRKRSFGGVFLVLATLSLLPGVSIIAGLMMIMPALQMIMGYRAPLLPRFLRECRISVNQIQTLGYKAVPWVEKIEHYIKPRWLALTSPVALILVAMTIMMLAVVITIPLPLSNFAPAITVICLAFGLLERDGLLIFVGLIFGVIALTIGILITYVAIESISHFLLNSK